MEIRPLRLPGTYEVILAPHRDDRGYFLRTYDEQIFRQQGLVTAWVQENQSLSTRKGILRGLHFQRPPHAETKLVRVNEGAIWDVFVDLRRNSPAYGSWDSIELSAQNRKMAYIPKGFAHGFLTLTENALVLYKVDAAYAPGAEGGLRWDDPALKIAWPVKDPFLSEKDRTWPSLADFISPF